MKRNLLFPMILTLLLVIGCTPSEEVLSDLDVSNKGVITELEEIASKNDGNSKKMQPPIWADCRIYSGIVNKATFKPESDPFDELYAIDGGSFKDGKPLISDSKPGDQDYNGGRWHLNVLKAEVSITKYENACSEEALDLNDFMSTDMYFSCPMRPRK